MKYMGSKRRIAKEILPIILANRREDQVYVEPFCGGCNTIDKVPQGAGRIASDIHLPLISLFKALQEGWIPPDVVTEEEYKEAKLLKDTDPLKGYIGFNCSFSGKWWGGFARYTSPTGKKQDFVGEANRFLARQLSTLQEVMFRHCSYKDLVLPERSLIYCDPPYKGTTSYKHPFNHEEFYQWCLDTHKKGHTVFISEYSMPSEFTEVWSKAQTTNLDNNKPSKQAIEKVFTIL